MTRSDKQRPAEMAKAYEAQQTEQRLYAWWEKQGFFTPKIDPARKPFTLSMPPPNVTGALWLRSNVTLHLEAGATLYGSAHFDDFPIWSSKWEGPNVKRGRAALICGEGLENVAVTGRGTIDGRGQIWWEQQAREPGSRGAGG